jgi:xanthine dehydrogenase accessory factor
MAPPMSDWLDATITCLQRGEPCALLTVAATEGSAPRRAGTKMFVGADAIAGSVGGGHLELKAIEQARAALLPAAPEARLLEFALGPSLGQCCGGRVTLFLEILTPAALPWLHAWQKAIGALVLVTRISPYAKEMLAPRNTAAHSLAAAIADLQALPETAALYPSGAAESCYLLERVEDPRHDLLLFGAGHVGRALVRILSLLPYRVRWIDSRADMFPAELPANVEAETSDAPHHDVARAPGGAFFLVMTHSHAADLEICDRVLKRDDFAYLGLIGSASKRASFLRRLKARGHGEASLARLVCPIGLPQVTGREPASIAVAVAGELLAVAEAIARDRRGVPTIPLRHAGNGTAR